MCNIFAPPLGFVHRPLRSGQNVTGATTSKDHPLKSQYSKDVGGCVRYKYPPDVAKVEAYLKQTKGMSGPDAAVKARSKVMSKYVRTLSRPRLETKVDLVRVFKMYLRADEVAVQNGELPLLNPEVPRGKNGPPGAQAVFNKLTRCVDKGCCQDPLPVVDM